MVFTLNHTQEKNLVIFPNKEKIKSHISLFDQIVQRGKPLQK